MVGPVGAAAPSTYDEADAMMCEQVIIFGTDVPGLKQGAFDEAVGLLDTHDVVFGPARDGGYYLVGLKHPHAAIFQNVEWSTSTVLSTTIANAQRHYLVVADPLRLPQLIDIDVVQVRLQHMHYEAVCM